MRRSAHQKAYQRLEKEGDRWAVALYAAFALAMYRHEGRKKTAVTRLIDETRKVWKECAADYKHSMIAMCEMETGIEIQNGDGSSWRDVVYLNGEETGPMTDAQWLYMRQQQIKWIRPNIMACIMVGMHRKQGYGYERCARLYAWIEEISQEFNGNAKKLNAAARDEVGVDIDYMIHKRRPTEDGKTENG